MTPSDERDPVDVLAEEFADRLRRGEHPSVSDFALAHPEYAEQLRELLPAVAQMEFLKRFRRAAGSGAREQLPDRFGDFRIVRELGRGGMGVVFEAVQESLGRPVALKVLATHAQLDPIRRERFIREAQAAARLHHTNIVPVFGVGEQDGLPYYVMQLIRGQGLHAVIHCWRQQAGKAPPLARSTLVTHKTDALKNQMLSTSGPVRGSTPEDSPKYGDWSFIAEMGLQAAEALHYAHKQGVLHRDVKPANLILDPAGRVWVADFGLAKLVDLHGLTASGDILGTLQYVAPECLSGDSDARSDVYGLGATLYELLTLEAPYPSDSPARLIKQVAEATPPAPRQLNPNIPHDLETIVLKAMAREPHQRYASARELASDLRAFLDDRPIRARRQSWLDRSVRWCRRNPTIAVLTTSTVAALALATVLGWVGYARTKRALDAEAARRTEAEKAQADADKARREAEEASIRLDANLTLSLQAFEKVFEAAGGTRLGPLLWFGPGGPGSPGGGPVGFVGPGGPSGPGRAVGALFGGGPGGGPAEAAATQAAVLEAILAFYDKFAEQNASYQGVTSAKLQFEAGKGYRRVGEAQLWLGNKEKTALFLRRAADLLEQLTVEFPGNDLYRIELVLTYLNAPWAPPGTFGPDAEKPLQRAAELVAAIPPHNLPVWISGGVQTRLGQVREAAGDRTGAEAAYRAAIAQFTRTPPEQRPEPTMIDLAVARCGLARMLVDSGKLAEAQQILKQSLAETEMRSKGGGPVTHFVREWCLVPTYVQLIAVSNRMGDRQTTDWAREGLDRFKLIGPGGPKKDGLGPKKI